MEVKGSVQEKNGVLYTVISYKGKDGKWVYKWKTTKLPSRGNKKKAEEMLSLEMDKYRNISETVNEEKTKFSDFIVFWLSMRKPKIQITTYDGYKHLIDKHIIPYFEEKNILLKDISSIDIQKYYNAKLSEGLSPNTVIKHHAVMRTALAYAVKTRMIKENPADFTDKPEKVKTEARYYNNKELNELFEVIRGEPIETVILLTAYLGLRRSEVLGIKWSNVDFDNNTIHIKHKVVRTFDENGKLTFATKDKMKSESSARAMPIPENVVKRLKAIKVQQKRNRMLFGAEYDLEFLDYVCVDIMGKLFKPDYVTHKFHNIIKKNEMKPLNFHGLRHSCASLLLSLGFQIRDIQEYLGHASYEITAKTYAHVDLARKNSMTTGINQALNF